MEQILSQYLRWFKNYNHVNLKVQFLREPVTILQFWCKNNRKCTIWMCQWIIMCEILWWNTIKDTRKSRPTQCRDKRPFVDDTRQLHHFATNFDRVLLQLPGTDIEKVCLNTEWAIGIWQSWLKYLNCLMKSCEKFNLLFVNIQCATACSLEKVNFKI